MSDQIGLEFPSDYARTALQRRAVFLLMRDSEWRTLAQISEVTGYPEASVSARLRDFRKRQFGAHTVDRRRVFPMGGQHEYRLAVDKGRG